MALLVQNVSEQARQFVAATEVNNLAITKLDGHIVLRMP